MRPIKFRAWDKKQSACTFDDQGDTVIAMCSVHSGMLTQKDKIIEKMKACLEDYANDLAGFDSRASKCLEEIEKEGV